MRRGLAERSKFVAPVAVCSRCSLSWGVVVAVPAGMVGGQGRSCQGGIEGFQWEKTPSFSPNHSTDGKCSRSLNCQAPAGVIPSFSANTLTASVGRGSFPSHFTKRSSFPTRLECILLSLSTNTRDRHGTARHRRRLPPVPTRPWPCSSGDRPRLGSMWCCWSHLRGPQGFPWCCPSRRALQRALSCLHFPQVLLGSLTDCAWDMAEVGQVGVTRPDLLQGLLCFPGRSRVPLGAALHIQTQQTSPRALGMARWRSLSLSGIAGQ